MVFCHAAAAAQTAVCGPDPGGKEPMMTSMSASVPEGAFISLISSYPTSFHLNWVVHCDWLQPLRELGRALWSDPVCRGCDRSQRTQFRRNEVRRDYVRWDEMKWVIWTLLSRRDGRLSILLQVVLCVVYCTPLVPQHFDQFTSLQDMFSLPTTVMLFNCVGSVIFGCVF